MIPNSVVVDTNLLFSALIPKASQIRDILLEKNMSFYAPNYLIAEIYKHKTRIISFSKLSESEFYVYFNGVIERINFIPIDFIGTESRQKAYDLCKNVDLSDIPFIALKKKISQSIAEFCAEFRRVKIWSRMIFHMQ